MSINFNSVSRLYSAGHEEVAALRDFSITVESGTMTALMGPSGSGKSTVLNICAGLDRPTSGEVFVLTTAINRMSSRSAIAFRRDNIGVVFQDNNLIREFNATENVMLPLLARGIKPHVATDLASEALDRLGVDNLSDRFPSEMSGGQIQRVGIARAIAGEKKVLLADEPTGALDSKNTREVFSALRALSDAGATVLIATHDPVIGDFADRIVSILDGALERDDRVRR